MRQLAAEDLVEACLAQRDGAWGELLHRYGRLIWSVPVRMGARSEEAEEVFQRTWVAIVEGLAGLERRQRVASFIAAIARHQTYRLFAENARHRRAESLDAHLERGFDPPGDTVHDAALEAIEADIALHTALDALDPRCRELLTLLFFSDPALDYREIALRCGLAVGSIGPVRARCLDRLRRSFEALYQMPTNGDT